MIEWEQAKVWEPPQDEQDKVSKRNQDKTRGGNTKGNGKDASKDSPRGKASSSDKKDAVKDGTKEVAQEGKPLVAKEKSKDGDKNAATVAKKKKKKKIVCPFLRNSFLSVPLLGNGGIVINFLS